MAEIYEEPLLQDADDEDDNGDDYSSLPSQGCKLVAATALVEVVVVVVVEVMLLSAINYPRHMDGIQKGAHHPRIDNRQSRLHQMLLIIIEIEESDG